MMKTEIAVLDRSGIRHGVGALLTLNGTCLVAFASASSHLAIASSHLAIASSHLAIASSHLAIASSHLAIERRGAFARA